jgi:hypothetical protein
MGGAASRELRDLERALAQNRQETRYSGAAYRGIPRHAQRAREVVPVGATCAGRLGSVLGRYRAHLLRAPGPIPSLSQHLTSNCSALAHRAQMVLVASAVFTRCPYFSLLPFVRYSCRLGAREDRLHNTLCGQARPGQLRNRRRRATASRRRASQSRRDGYKAGSMDRRRLMRLPGKFEKIEACQEMYRLGSLGYEKQQDQASI